MRGILNTDATPCLVEFHIGDDDGGRGKINKTKTLFVSHTNTNTKTHDDDPAKLTVIPIFTIQFRYSVFALNESSSASWSWYVTMTYYVRFGPISTFHLLSFFIDTHTKLGLGSSEKQKRLCLHSALVSHFNYFNLRFIDFVFFLRCQIHDTTHNNHSVTNEFSAGSNAYAATF